VTLLALGQQTNEVHTHLLKCSRILLSLRVHCSLGSSSSVQKVPPDGSNSAKDHFLSPRAVISLAHAPSCSLCLGTTQNA
jgi:hypothetical protein